jgi:hypothetical protein
VSSLNPSNAAVGADDDEEDEDEDDDDDDDLFDAGFATPLRTDFATGVFFIVLDVFFPRFHSTEPTDALEWTDTT